ncbi:hypothetical protein HJC23_009491 [Cyclotella cryptica]|uniref:Uncharacterized protein n=1 Tax=Cyclotella cryptica TaxID=29204 RepID=A0ABD3P8N9_9STRA
MANLDLSVNSPDHPKIDGIIGMTGDRLYDSYSWIGDEYASFTESNTWNQGNDKKEHWGMAFIAYDCKNKILCIATHLAKGMLDDSIPQSDAYSWIRLGMSPGEQKLFIKNTSASAATYVFKPESSNEAVGYEGCWDVSDYETLGRLVPVTNDYVTIHFDKDTSNGTGHNTVSTGMDSGSGTICLTQDCSTRRPTMKPPNRPSSSRTESPSDKPSILPSTTPSISLLTSPSMSPTNSPTASPSLSPSKSPSKAPSVNPSMSPSTLPSSSPSTSPSSSPSNAPSMSPSDSPSNSPAPSNSPSASPSQSPSKSPSSSPTSPPSDSPSFNRPSKSPSISPSMSPSTSPSNSPMTSPSHFPTSSPSTTPTSSPTASPSCFPSNSLTVSPSMSPSASPSNAPIASPSQSPSSTPIVSPSTTPTFSPTANPSQPPSISPSSSPSVRPSTLPSNSPSVHLTRNPSESPLARPTFSPSVSSSLKPTVMPSSPPIRLPFYIEDNCCPEDTGVCNADGHTFGLPLLNLTKGSFGRPVVDGKIDMLGDNLGDFPPIPGWILAEYSSFLELPMFNGEKNSKDGSPFVQEGRIGTAYLAYDCANNIVCVAAHLDASFLENHPNIQLDQLDGESSISFGESNGSKKLNPSNADEFKYVGKPNDSKFIIGYEGC